MRHELKCHADNYDAIVSGYKRFEVRHEDDRTFTVGDTLRLTRTDTKGIPTSPPRRCEVYVLHVARMAGPLTLFGAAVDEGGVQKGQPVNVAVLSICDIIDAKPAGASK